MVSRDQITRSFPRLSPATAELLRSLSRDPGLREVAEIVSRDPALSARVLQTANSSLYARTHEITDIVQAAVTLGRDAIRRLAISSGLRRSLASGKAQHLTDPIWRHSVATAVFAQALEQAANPDSSDAYTGGLLHDVGAMALAVWKPDDYSGIVKAGAQPGFNRTEWEREHLGVDRRTVGGWLAEDWELPERLHEAIDLDEEVVPSRSLANLVRTSSQLAELHGYGLYPAPEGSTTDSILAGRGLAGFADALPAEEDLRAAVDLF